MLNKDDVPRQVHKRITDVYINDGYTEEDEISYTLPMGYRLDNLPVTETLKKSFGSFITTISVQRQPIDI